MKDTTLVFDEGSLLGHVTAVDTSRVYINVENHSLLTRISVGNLAAIEGNTSLEYLIGIIERVTRQLAEEALIAEEDADGNIPIQETQRDVVRLILVGTFRFRDGKRRNTFKRGADSFPQIDKTCHIIESQNLERLMNIMSAELPAEKRLALGKYVGDGAAEAVADGDRFFQRHAAVLGSTGSGKSCAVALLLEKASALDYPNLILLDVHGEYAPLTKAQGGFAEGFRVAGPGDLDNPNTHCLFLPYWLLTQEEAFALLLDRSEVNAPNQASRFLLHVRNLKAGSAEAAKSTEVERSFTVDSPIPYSLDKLISLLEGDDTRKGIGARGGDVKGEWEGKLTRFISRLSAKKDDRRYGFLFQPPEESAEYNWLAEQAVKLLASEGGTNGIKIIDFSEVPSDVLPVMLAVFARLLYQIQFWLAEKDRTPFTIVCDEAHLYLPTKDGIGVSELRAVEVFERIAKEGRKYGVSLLVISQRPADVSRTILSQCNNFLVLRLTNDQDQNVVSRLMPDSMAMLTETLPLLDVGEGLLLGDAVLLPTRLKLSLPTIKPASATLDFWTAWEQAPPNASAIRGAVESMRRQRRT